MIQTSSFLDLKPDNLMLVADPIAPGGERVKILDFGIAKLTKAADRATHKTDTKAVIGTPMYMSPEQCAGAGGVDDKTDVYSLGCVLYEMLGGQPPFVAEGAGQLVGMHLFRKPAPLISLAPKLPPKVAELVHLLLTKDKSLRPAMSEACEGLGRVLAKLPGAGSVVRSRPSAPTDPDAANPIGRAITTLGQSIGQQAAPSPWRLRLLLVGTSVLLLAGLLAFLLHGTQKTLPVAASPARPPAPAPAPPRPQSMVSQPAPQPAERSPVKEPVPVRPLPNVKAAGHKPSPPRPAPAPGSPSVNRPKQPKANVNVYVD